MKSLIALLLLVSGPAFAQTWSGDLRYRGVQLKESTDEARLYQQLRARLAFRADVNEDVQAVLRLMTASSAISGNQTLGDAKNPGMPRREFGLDWGYIDWKFVPEGHLWAGRTANPFWSPNKVQSLFDADLAFEGLAAKWEPRFSESTTGFINLATYIIAENFNDKRPKTDVVDTGLVGGDVGVVVKSDDWTWTSHLGNYYYLNIKDKKIGSVVAGASGIDSYSSSSEARYLGNTVYADDVTTPTAYYYKYQYVLAQAGTEFKHKIDAIEYTVFADYIHNTAVSKDSSAYEAGVGVKWKFITLSFASIMKGRDALVGAFTDSDTNGGGTDVRGTRVTAQFQLAKNTTLALIHHQAKRGLSSVQRDFTSTFADLQVSF
ncbi:MAG: putative porin [Bdellovibrionales bacterium]|nr:putative porin [Bdellovibrionales bacterium]